MIRVDSTTGTTVRNWRYEKELEVLRNLGCSTRHRLLSDV